MWGSWNKHMLQSSENPRNDPLWRLPSNQAREGQFAFFARCHSQHYQVSSLKGCGPFFARPSDTDITGAFVKSLMPFQVFTAWRRSAAKAAPEILGILPAHPIKIARSALSLTSPWRTLRGVPHTDPEERVSVCGWHPCVPACLRACMVCAVCVRASFACFYGGVFTCWGVFVNLCVCVCVFVVCACFCAWLVCFVCCVRVGTCVCS